MVSSSPSVIIGPSGSGKTSLVAMLSHATTQQARDDPRLTCEVRPLSETMKDEIKKAQQELILDGKWERTGTQTLVDFEFDFGVRHNSSRFSRSVSRRFILKDSRGGLLFDKQDKTSTTAEKERKDVVQALMEADGIIICADATNAADPTTQATTTGAFVGYFPSVMADLGAQQLRCRRIVFCLTKSEDLVASYRYGAMQRLELANAAATCRRLIGEANINALKARLKPDAEVMAGWGSIFGFDTDTGSANYDRQAAKRSVKREQFVLRPFRIHEPFVFLTSGDRMNLQSLFSAEEERERRVRRWFGAAERRVDTAKRGVNDARDALERRRASAKSADSRATSAGSVGDASRTASNDQAQDTMDNARRRNSTDGASETPKPKPKDQARPAPKEKDDEIEF